jgi:methyl-galactoside transport system substrate-binding protein
MQLSGGVRRTDRSVFANNDDMALGAIDACLDAGLTAEELPFIVGVDATPPL